MYCIIHRLPILTGWFQSENIGECRGGVSPPVIINAENYMYMIWHYNIFSALICGYFYRFLKYIRLQFHLVA